MNCFIQGICISLFFDQIYTQLENAKNYSKDIQDITIIFAIKKTWNDENQNFSKFIFD